MSGRHALRNKVRGLPTLPAHLIRPGVTLRVEEQRCLFYVPWFGDDHLSTRLP